jgi:hypothetical protein
MNVVASPEVGTFVRDHGGRLFVWTDARRCCGGAMVFLSADPLPKGDRSFDRVEAGTFEVWFAGGRASPPEELRLELKGRRRKHVEAYWDGCVFTI